MTSDTALDLQQVSYSVDRHVATVALNRPAKLNAWTLQMAAELRLAMRRAADDPGVRVIVFTGTGRGFCAGGDMGLLDNIRADRDQHSAKPQPPFDPRSSVDFHGLDNYFPAIPKPIIAAVNGVSAGIGMVYPLYCDLRFASSEAYFFTAFSRRGAIAEHGMAWMLPRLVGMAHAFDLLYSARRITADEAARMGLVNRVLPAEDLMSHTLDYAHMLAEEVSPRSLAVMKRQVWGDLTRPLGAAVAVAQAEMDLGFLSEDFAEGVRHYVEKRAPRFTGR